MIPKEFFKAVSRVTRSQRNYSKQLQDQQDPKGILQSSFKIDMIPKVTSSRQLQDL
jgi:hypothetical protein